MTADWRQNAACKDVDPDKFFRPGHVPQELHDLCGGCRALIPCTFAALRRTDIGFAAGLTYADRLVLRRWNRAAKKREAAKTKRAAKTKATP